MKNFFYDVLTVGNAIVDIINPTEFSFLTKHSLVSGSMNLINENESDLLLKDANPKDQIAGGSAANTAVGIASFGGSAKFIGKVKNDSLGKIFEKSLELANVNFDTPKLTNGPNTAHSIISITPDAERTMCTYLGACLNLSSEDITEENILNAKIHYIEGYLLDSLKAHDVINKLIKFANQYKKITSISLADSFCVERHRKKFIDLLKQEINIIFANEQEIKSLFETENFENAINSALNFSDTVVVTRGTKGSVVAQKNTFYSFDAIQVKKVIDKNGAGDSFAAGFLFGVSKNYDLQKCGELGNIAATEIITQYGARPEKKLSEILSNYKL